jgi:hypothetical protein
VTHHPLETERVIPFILHIYLAIAGAKSEIPIHQHRILVVFGEEILELFELLYIASILVSINQFFLDTLNLIDLRL